MNKKQKILITMLELVVKRGVHGTTISLLSRKTGISPSTIYYYFKNKQEIINEIYKMIRLDFNSVLSQDKEQKSPEEIFKTYWDNLYHYYISNPLAFKFYEFIARPPIISQEIINNTEAFFIDHTNFFTEGIANGTLKNMELKLLVQLATKTVVAAVNLHQTQTLTMDKTQLNDAMDAAWDLVRNTKA